MSAKLLEVPAASEVYRLCAEAGALPLAEAMIDAQLPLYSVRSNLATLTGLIAEFPARSDFIVSHYVTLFTRDQRTPTGGAR